MESRNRIIARFLFPFALVAAAGMVLFMTYVCIKHYNETGENSFGSWLIVSIICTAGFIYIIRESQKEFGWFRGKK